MTNFIYLSPNFPENHWNFCHHLKQNGLNVLGISCLTNYAAGVTENPLNHQEVIETADRVKESFKNLLSEFIKQV